MHILYAQVKPADPRDKQPPSRKRRAEGRLEALDRRIGNAALPRPRSRKPRPGAGHAVSAEARPTLRVQVWRWSTERPPIAHPQLAAFVFPRLHALWALKNQPA